VVLPVAAIEPERRRVPGIHIAKSVVSHEQSRVSVRPVNTGRHINLNRLVSENCHLGLGWFQKFTLRIKTDDQIVLDDDLIVVRIHEQRCPNVLSAVVLVQDRRPLQTHDHL